MAEGPSTARACGGLLPLAIVKGMTSFMAGDVPDVEHPTLLSWVVSFFLGFTILVLTTSYTAVVTSSLVQADIGQITSLKDGLAKGLKFCVHDSSASLLYQLHPDLQPLAVEVDHALPEPSPVVRSRKDERPRACAE